MVQTYHDRIGILLNPDANIGGPTLSFIKTIWAKHTATALRQEKRLLALARRYSYSRLDAACRLAIADNKPPSVNSVLTILQKNLDLHCANQPDPSNLESPLPRKNLSK